MEVNLLKVVLLALVLSLSCKVIASPTAYLPIGADTYLELQIEHLFARFFKYRCTISYLPF
jgi:hypothetical protein